ncbi:hypothetical protein ABZ671_15065 [Micromonospora sp. NPDC006766]|uniref:hypothetical protein n=1 Tax=Micromonospora sp. NPDC006766 TaxID=3154778 RepID=UPI0033CEE05D
MRLNPYAFMGLSSLIAGPVVLLLGRLQSDYAAFAGALVAGGSALVWLGISGRRIGRAAWIAVGALAVVGVFGSLLIVREEISCMYCYYGQQGYPWGWIDTGFSHDHMPTVQHAHQIMATNPEIVGRSIDGFKAFVDGTFWGYVALPLAAVTTQVGRVLQQARQVASS